MNLIKELKELREARGKAVPGEWRSFDNYSFMIWSDKAPGKMKEDQNAIETIPFISISKDELLEEYPKGNNSFLLLAANRITAICERVEEIEKELERWVKSEKIGSKLKNGSVPVKRKPASFLLLMLRGEE